ncbi:hypothetical protein BH09ACT6_BH09ACT6_15440 [soil metagenome]
MNDSDLLDGYSADFAPNTYLLTYNPRFWAWDDYDEFLDQVRRERLFEGQWSTGSRVNDIGPGDEVFLLRQGREPRGIIARGLVASEVYEDETWLEDGTSRLANYVDVDWKEAVPLTDPLPLAALQAGTPDAPKSTWEPQSSGTRIAQENAIIASLLWLQHLRKAT